MPDWFRRPNSTYARHAVAYAIGTAPDSPYWEGRLRDWQQRNGLRVTGVVDSATASAIGDVEIPWLIESLLPLLSVSTEEVRQRQAELGIQPTGTPDDSLRRRLVVEGHAEGPLS